MLLLDSIENLFRTGSTTIRFRSLQLRQSSSIPFPKGNRTARIQLLFGGSLKNSIVKQTPPPPSLTPTPGPSPPYPTAVPVPPAPTVIPGPPTPYPTVVPMPPPPPTVTPMPSASPVNYLFALPSHSALWTRASSRPASLPEGYGCLAPVWTFPMRTLDAL